MTGSDADLRDRLQRAALALFSEHGFDRTTAAGISAAAGVTERTFFRHFADKREVLFVGAPVLQAALTDAVARASGGLGPLDLLFAAFRSVLPLLEANRPFAKPRQAVITATPALAERELAKHAALADALAAALHSRGVDVLRATLAARTALAAFVHVTAAWLDDPALALDARLDLAHRALATLLDAGDA